MNINREALAIDVNLNLRAGRAVRVLEWLLTGFRSYPLKVTSDNGPEFAVAPVN